MAQSLKDRVLGSLLGLAIGDALGTTVEFMPPGSFEEVTDMQGGGKFSLQSGQVSFEWSPASLLWSAWFVLINYFLLLFSGQMIQVWRCVLQKV